jgi:hypothetical protein
MFIIIWEYRVKQEYGEEFQKQYGPEGIWVKFFKQGRGYCNTQLLKDSKEEGHYITIDSWYCKTDYQRFLNQSISEYDCIDKQCQSFTEYENKIGEFIEITDQADMK